jgi:galactokinase
VEEIARVEAACAALQIGDFGKLGRLMFQGHDGLNLQYEVCVPETNFLVEWAREASTDSSHKRRVLGARQMGGGFGGCTLNLLKTSELDVFLEEISAAYRRLFDLELKAYPVQLGRGVEAVNAS